MIMMANRTAMGTKCKRLDSRKGVSMIAESIGLIMGSLQLTCSMEF